MVFKAGPLIPPSDPSIQLWQLQAEIESLRHELTEANIQLDSSQQLNNLIVQEKVEFEVLALAMDGESRQLVKQAKAQQQEHEQKLKSLVKPVQPAR